ncbi:hypothetical protein [Flavobacterium sp. 7A]|uniref:hypothetical protein n=1 Tax=Flavobacterium sp. 7A TaxID=2940571 RepID=UPI00222722BA|nr:hypothetical protein [Flavobacterium sp. 7A]MCW2121201.1 hypothetical protein [Flavobacterium sp. 7A]
MEDANQLETAILDFCLQQNNSEIIVTLLINNVPLYDCIVVKHIANSFLNEIEKNEFIVSSYNFEIYPLESIEEEELFYHNFPKNVSPVDYKHQMVGLSLKATFCVLASKHLDLEALFLKGEKISVNDLNDFYLDKKQEKIVILSHSCGVINCSNVSMHIKKESGRVVWDNFYWFNENFHQKVTFQFEENQYLETLQKLKILVEELKTYENYCDFQSDSFYNPQEFKE